MANNSTIGVGFLFITPVLLFCCFVVTYEVFWAKVCFLGILRVFGVFSLCRCVFLLSGI